MCYAVYGPTHVHLPHFADQQDYEDSLSADPQSALTTVIPAVSEHRAASVTNMKFKQIVEHSQVLRLHRNYTLQYSGNWYLHVSY